MTRALPWAHFTPAINEGVWKYENYRNQPAEYNTKTAEFNDNEECFLLLFIICVLCFQASKPSTDYIDEMIKYLTEIFAIKSIIKIKIAVVRFSGEFQDTSPEREERQTDTWQCAIKYTFAVWWKKSEGDFLQYFHENRFSSPPLMLLSICPQPYFPNFRGVKRRQKHKP